jgi:phage-related minor tail protein
MTGDSPDAAMLGEAMQGQLARLSTLSEAFGRSLTSALGKAGDGGRKLDDVLRGLGLRLGELALKGALNPLQAMLGGLGGQMTNALSAGTGSGVSAFARGGVLSRPALFPLAGGWGLAGEAGSEAILPLSRGPDGRLGVAAGQGTGRPVHVTMHVTTPDAESFRRSEAQFTAALARAVARGQRTM